MWQFNVLSQVDPKQPRPRITGLLLICSNVSNTWPVRTWLGGLACGREITTQQGFYQLAYLIEQTSVHNYSAISISQSFGASRAEVAMLTEPLNLVSHTAYSTA